MLIIKRAIAPVLRLLAARPLLKGITPQSSFAIMKLFESPKKPEELSPVFKKPERLKGHLRAKDRKGYISPKLNPKVREKKKRLKNHKGMLKRIKIVDGC
jgi:hypothetical protein